MGRNGCCDDKACNAGTCMTLPDGKTCGDCARFRFCASYCGAKATWTSCDWFPRRFVPNGLTGAKLKTIVVDDVVEVPS